MSIITVSKVSGSIGAAVHGVNLGLITDADFEVVHQAFLEHCVLVFPDQFLSVDDHVAFASRWGEFSVSPFVNYLDTHPMVLPLNNRGKSGTVTENWHTDSAFLPEPPALNVLSARNVPRGGDTMFCNQYRSYNRLSPGLQHLLRDLRAEFTGARLAALAGSDEVPSTFHPVVRTHPETGHKSIYLTRPGDSVPRFENMTNAESMPLLQFLYEHSVQPDNVYRHQWNNGDVVMWDNRCTMHYAVHDYGDDPRDIHRISIQGSVPF